MSSLLSNARLGLRSLARTPFRSFLLLQGVAWGVGIAVFPAAVLDGSRAAALARADEVGTGRVVLEAEPGTRPLTPADAAHLDGGLPGVPGGVRAGAFRAVTGAAAAAGARAATVDLLGTGPAGALVRGQRLAEGRYLREGDADACVLEPLAAGALLPGPGPRAGRRVEVVLPGGGRRALEVVGVLAPRSADALRTDDLGLETDHRLRPLVGSMLRSLGVESAPDAWKRSERCVHLPLALLPREGDAADCLVLRADPREAAAAAEAARAALVARGATPLARANLVWPFLASTQVDEYLRLKDALVLACLLMGSAVVCQAMLLSVMERRGEIAVRRAEGATAGDIGAQFLAEAAALGVAGAALGVPLGLGLAWLRVEFAPYTTFAVALPVGESLAASACAVAAALAGGVLPARRAAALDPLEALRAP